MDPHIGRRMTSFDLVVDRVPFPLDPFLVVFRYLLSDTFTICTLTESLHIHTNLVFLEQERSVAYDTDR